METNILQELEALINEYQRGVGVMMDYATTAMSCAYNQIKQGDMNAARGFMGEAIWYCSGSYGRRRWSKTISEWMQTNLVDDGQDFRDWEIDKVSLRHGG